jgi:AraC-like DNA-binding protein
MKVSLSLNDLHELFEEFKQKAGASYHTDGSETVLELPSSWGRSRLYNLSLREGLELYIQEHNLEEDLAIESSARYSMWGLGFCLLGCFDGTVDSTRVNVGMRSGQSMLMFASNASSTIAVPARQRLHLIEIGLKPQVFQTLVAQEWEAWMNWDFRRAIANDAPRFYLQMGQLTPIIEVVLHQILHCPYQGSIKRLYLESKTLELIALQLTQLTQGNAKGNARKLKPSDIERIYQARDILMGNLDNPPSLLALAHQVGLNDYKLKQGFRQVFGTTTFGYLHTQRMERSRLLLESSTMNVTQVAQAVGYTNISQFAAAFRKQFGVNPSVFKAQQSTLE